MGEIILGHAVKTAAPLFLGRLAELEAERNLEEIALAEIQRAMEAGHEVDMRLTDSLLHRIHGDILLKFRPADRAPAEQAYLAAIKVAREQGARSFALLAALKLAKLYQSTNRLVEAHDVLSVALERFTPTLEMPEIAEGLDLLAQLSG